MKKLILTYIMLAIGTLTMAQNKMLVHRSGETDVFEVTEADSVFFSEDNATVFLKIAGEVSEYAVAEVDSITFDVTLDSTVYITYEGTSVSVINPLSNAGVEVAVDGTDVVVHSTSEIKDINYVLSGSTDDGSFKMYSDERYNLLLNSLNLTHSDGPAINIQSGKKARVNLVSGTSSTLTDGTDYADPAIDENGEEEDQSATFFSEGELIFIGSGSLMINSFGSDQHGIRSDDYIQIEEGFITITSAEKDGIHGKEGFYMNGGTVNITSSGDGVDGSEGVVEITGGHLVVNSIEDDVKGIKSDTTITVSGGIVEVVVEGDRSKGIDSDQEIFFTGGNIVVETAGSVVLEDSGEGFDPSYCSAISSDSDVHIGNSTINIISTGAANRGISCDGSLYIDGADITVTASGDGDTYTNEDGDDDAYHGTGINVDEDFIFTAGTITVSHSGAGGRGISTDGGLTIGEAGTIPVLNITTTGERITITPGGGGPGGGSGDYDEAKAVKSDGPVVIQSGLITISSADDGIKSEESITINEGSVSILESIEGLEAPYVTINGGNVHVEASDDGLNTTFGGDSHQNDGSLLSITGGYVYVSTSSGDALDSNGDITISGGTTVVHGPPSSPELALDFNGDCFVTSGFLVASGTNSNMLEGPSNSSSQYSLLLKSNANVSANTLFHIEDSDGNEVVTFAPERNYRSVIFTSSVLSTGTTYRVYTGGSSTGTETDGLYTGGSYSGGTLKATFTISNTVTNVTF